MIYKTTILLLSLAFALTGCSDSKQEESKTTKQVSPAEVKPQPIEVAEKKPTVKKIYNLDEIYTHMCIECHSADGSGNTDKLTPSMKNLSQQEIEDSLAEIENDQGHVIMEHNRGEIIKMGMEYSAKDMAEYMFKRFSPKNQ